MHRYARNRHDKCPATMCKRSHGALIARNDETVAAGKYAARFSASEARALEALSTHVKNGRVLACFVSGLMPNRLAGVVVVIDGRVLWGNFSPCKGFKFEIVPHRTHGLSANDVRRICGLGSAESVVFKPLETR